MTLLSQDSNQEKWKKGLFRLFFLNKNNLLKLLKLYIFFLFFSQQIANVIDDDMDFMLADEGSLQSNSDTAPLAAKDNFNFDAELQLEGEDAPEESTDGSWFSQSVHRVRRSLSRLFGGEEKQKEQSRSRRLAIERQKERRRQAKEQRQLETRQRQEIRERQRQDQQAKRLAHGPFKRDSFDETEGSGNEGDQEQDFISCESISFSIKSDRFFFNDIVCP